MENDTQCLIETKLEELQGLVLKYENERLKSNDNLSTISNTHESIIRNEPKNYKKKLSSLYQNAINDADKEIILLKEALGAIHDIRVSHFEKRQFSNNEDGTKGTIRRGTLMDLLSHIGMNLPLWIGKKNESAPPLCGANPAESNYIAKVGDMVAALPKETDDEGKEVWILAKVVNFNQNRYEVDDIDDDAKARHVLSRKRVVPLPLLRANPETNSQALFAKDTHVLALYPRTTCFYHAKVEEPPSKPFEDYKLLFEDGRYNNNFSPPMTVPQRYVINYRESRKK